MWGVWGSWTIPLSAQRLVSSGSVWMSDPWQSGVGGFKLWSWGFKLGLAVRPLHVWIIKLELSLYTCSRTEPWVLLTNRFRDSIWKTFFFFPFLSHSRLCLGITPDVYISLRNIRVLGIEPWSPACKARTWTFALSFEPLFLLLLLLLIWSHTRIYP